MIRLLGGVLTVLSGFLIGFLFGQKQKDTLAKQELLYAYLDCMCCELQYYAAPLEQIVKKLVQRSAFESFEFAAVCAQVLKNRPFSEQFEAAAEQHKACFGNEICSDLKLLASQLGSESLEAQLSALSVCKHSITQTVEQERPRVMQNVKLMRSLGTFAGMAVLILFW